ncbi:MAG: peptidase E [Armatimonadetes bacterium]|nr:peptidase E [Anaerolineae bacterium]
MIQQQIIALGGGGFSMEPENPLLDRYIIAQTTSERPKVCFLPTASSESDVYVVNFYAAFTALGCKPSHLYLFRPHTADIADFLLSHDVIYVGGGNTKSMLAVWRAWGLDYILRQALEHGVVLAGISAGAICWFEAGLTDSIPGKLSPLPCLSYLPGSATPHYDGEAARRPAYQQQIAEGMLPPGIALDDGAAAHYVNGQLSGVVSSRPAARAYQVIRGTDGGAHETALPTQYLGR